MTTFNYQNNYQQNNYQQYNSKNPLQLYYNPLYNHQQFNNLFTYINQPNITNLIKSNQLNLQFFLFNSTNNTIHLYNNNIYSLITSIKQINNLHQYINSPTIIQQLNNQQLIIYYIIYNPSTLQIYNQFHKIINKSLNTYTQNNLNNINNQQNNSHNNFNQLLNTNIPNNS